MTGGVCHCEEAAPTKQSGSAGLLLFARNDMNLSVRIPHHPPREPSLERGFNMRRFISIVAGFLFAFALGIPLLAREMYYHPPDRDKYVSLEVVGDERGTLSVLWPERYGRWDSHNFQGTLEASRGERYRLRLTNCTDSRIGLVIAVDGRNIISGDRSYQRPSESMYVLNPRQTGVFNGWRSGMSRENRFYFTSETDSYAGSWGDTSRLGFIEVSVFMERPRPEPIHPIFEKDQARSRSDNAPGASVQKSEESSPGTGYGEEIYSRVRETDFDPESFPAERISLKYEWPSAFHTQNDHRYHAPSPRYAPDEDDSGFAPPPPRR